MKTSKKQDEKNLSYESDGKMGKQKKGKSNKERDFFNTTPNSE